MARRRAKSNENFTNPKAPDPRADGRPTGGDDESTPVPEDIRAGHGDLPLEPEPDGKPPTSRILSIARKVENFKAGKGLSRQLDISLMTSPKAKTWFMAWPDEADYLDVFLLRVKHDDWTKEIFIVTEEIATLPHMVENVIAARLIPCLSSTGTVFVWAQAIPDPDDKATYRLYEAMRKGGVIAREGWTKILWQPFRVETPADPAAVTPRQWPSGQTPLEWYDLATRPYIIDDPKHPVIESFRAIERIVLEDTRS
jgi:hypothetical protein